MLLRSPLVEDGQRVVPDRLGRPLNEETIQGEIKDSFDTPGLHSNLYRVQQEKHSRTIRYKDIDVVTVDSAFCGDNSLPPLPSSLLLYIATKESGLIAKLREAYENEDVAALKAMGSDFKDQMGKMEVLSVADATDEIVQSPVFFDARYGAKTLAPDFTMKDGIELSGVHFPWNGGKLDEGQFQAVEYIQPGERAEGYDYLIVARPPELSAFEQKVLDAVPDDMSETNLSNIVMCPAFCGAIVLVITVLTALGRKCRSMENELHAAMKDGFESGPATPRELLRLRRQVFEKYRN